jgi:aminoglycoside phosphotransferase (APT) family kinase protein
MQAAADSVAPPWASERVVDAETAARLVALRFLDLAGRPVTPLAEGWDSTVFTVGGDWAVQFPRRAAVVPGLRREIEVLPRIAAALPLPISVPERVADDDDAEDPWPFAGCRFISGVELAESGLMQGERVAVAAAVGGFLAVLHRIDPTPFADVLPVDPNGRGLPAGQVEHLRSVLESLTRRRVAIVESAVAERIEDLFVRAAALGEPTDPPVLVHGDLHARHVIVDPGGRAAGIIDWVDVCRADPALDLSIAYSAFVGPARTALFAAYGTAIDEERELRARLVALKLSLILADYAFARRLGTLLAESVHAIARSVC